MCFIFKIFKIQWSTKLIFKPPVHLLLCKLRQNLCEIRTHCLHKSHAILRKTDRESDKNLNIRFLYYYF